MRARISALPKTWIVSCGVTGGSTGCKGTIGRSTGGASMFFIGRENCGTAVSKRCLLLPFGFVAFLLLLVSHAALCRPCPVRAAVAFVACLLRSSERSCLRAVLPCPSLRFLYAQNLVEHVVDDHAVRESLAALVEEFSHALMDHPHDELGIVCIGDRISRVDGEAPGCGRSV